MTKNNLPLNKIIGKFLHQQSNDSFARYLTNGGDDGSNPEQAAELERSRLLYAGANLFYREEEMIEDELESDIY